LVELIVVIVIAIFFVAIPVAAISTAWDEPPSYTPPPQIEQHNPQGFNMPVQSVRMIVYVPAQDVEDAPEFTNKEELVAEVTQSELFGNRVVLLDQDGNEIDRKDLGSLRFK